MANDPTTAASRSIHMSSFLRLSILFLPDGMMFPKVPIAPLLSGTCRPDQGIYKLQRDTNVVE
jgi:hypothetical protein